ncbi:hypothetical protein IJD44_10285 [bacterium]|nr:hypothetical protein [bacterium]
MNIPKNGINAKNISFAGHKRKLDKEGYEVHKFYYMFDPKRYNCELEIYNIEKDDENNIVLGDKVVSYPLRDSSGIEKNMDDVDGLDTEFGFAYRFRLNELDKNGNPIPNKISYGFDNGQVLGIFNKEAGNQYNVILNNRAVINKNGPMQLIMPDGYYPGVERNIDGSLHVAEQLRSDLRKATRTHANKLGGQFIGITKRLQDGDFRKEGISRIVGTPFTKDSISSHLYWTENAYQVSPGLGTEKDFREMQEELFKNGINWIADAALVNEGFGGIHMSELLRKGDEAISKNMFRVEGERVALGILPNDAQQKGFTRLKLVNPPFVLSENGKEFSPSNPDYDPSKPTYIQFYDERLVSEEQKKSSSVSRLSTYDKKNVDGNLYAVTKHDDAVYPFPIEVSPEELTRNIQKIYKAEGEVKLDDVNTIKRVADFSTFSVVDKSSAGGLEFWDGNVDIAKLNFFRSVKDDTRFYKLQPEKRQKAIEDFERGTYAVREYAVNSGKYWTQLTADTQFEYASRYFASKGAKNADDYLRIIKSGATERTKNGKVTSDLPPSAANEALIDKEVIETVLNGSYNLRRLFDTDMRSEINPENDFDGYTLNDYVMKKAMDVPLETLPVATNLLGIITSPYISKKPNTEEEIGVSRYDTYKAKNPNLPDKYSYLYNKAENFYVEKLTPAIKSILSGVDGLTNEDGTVSDFGRYVISEVTPDLVRYLLVRSFNSNIAIPADENGVFDFSKVPADDITMQSLGIRYNSMTSEEEAQVVLNAMNKGIAQLENDGTFDLLKQNVIKRIGGRTLNDYRIAEMLIDRTESGLGWRIDAAKDVASIDAVRADYDTIDSAWDKTVSVWKLFNQSVLKVNPHAYTTAEITDLDQLMGENKHGIYSSDSDAERKFLQETGITSIANYTYFFSFIPDLFGKLGLEGGFDDNCGWQADKELTMNLFKKLDTGWGEARTAGFLFQTPDDGVVNSYNFVGNHDKPRILHLLSLDKFLYESDFSSVEHQKIANSVLGHDLSDYDKVKAPAIAMGSRLNQSFEKLAKTTNVIDENELELLKQAVSKLASGSYKGNVFDAEAFGTRPVDIALDTVFDQYEFNTGSAIPEREKLKALVMKDIMEPALDRLYSIYKMMVVLPGSPTDFAGDRVGVSGYETKAKNYHQQNRNIIHWEVLNDPKYAFIKTGYDKLNEIATLRNKPELSALNDGSNITMNVTTKDEYGNDTTNQVQGLIRYNDESTVLCFFDNRGANSPLDKPMDREGKVPHITADDVDPAQIKKKKAPGKTRISDENNRLYLFNDDSNLRRGLKHGIEPGTIFGREGSDVEYIVRRDESGRYYLTQKTGYAPIEFDNRDFNALLFYKKSN